MGFFFLLLIPLSNLLGTGKLREKNNKKEVSVSEQNSNRLNESLLQTTAGENQIVSKAGGTHLYFQTLIRLIVATVIKKTGNWRPQSQKWNEEVGKAGFGLTLSVHPGLTDFTKDSAGWADMARLSLV